MEIKMLVGEICWSKVGGFGLHIDKQFTATVSWNGTFSKFNRRRKINVVGSNGVNKLWPSREHSPIKYKTSITQV